jgi:hypothetical protein
MEQLGRTELDEIRRHYTEIKFLGYTFYWFNTSPRKIYEHIQEVKKFRSGNVIESLPQNNFCKVCNLPTDGKKCYSKRCPI